MTPLRRTRRLALAALAVLAASMPHAAAAQSYFERCAVGIRLDPNAGYASIIRMYGSTNYQPNVQTDAAVCTDLIGQGWQGMSKYGEWERRNGGLFRPVCGVGWDWGDVVTVYTLPGNEYLGWWDCRNSFDGGSVRDLTNLY